RDMIKEFFAAQNLAFGKPEKVRELTDEEQDHLFDLADLAARCRSAVSRDYRNRERVGSRKSELGTRLSGSLGQLLLGMDRIGVSPPAYWRILHKIAIDSMPDPRRLIVEALTRQPYSTRDLSRLTGLCLSVTKRTLDDLQIQDVVRR